MNVTLNTVKLAFIATYRRVVTVSSKLLLAGESVASIQVKEFPPNDCWSTRVSFELRYGINTFLRGCLPVSANLLMTMPSVVNDLLILAPSL